MDRITPILQCQWRAYWRQLTRPGSLRSSNQGILLLLSILVFVRYVFALRIAGVELTTGKTGMLEKLLLGIFLVWLFPLMNTSRLKIVTAGLRQLPLTVKDLLMVKIASLFVPPFAWLILAASLAISFPLSKAAEPIAGIVAAILFVVISFLIGLTVAQLVSVSAWRKVLAIALLLIAGVVAYSVSRGHSLSFQVLSFAPWKLVASVATGKTGWSSIALLLLMSVLAAAATFWSFQANLSSQESNNRQIARQFSLFFGKTGPLSSKDYRYFRRLLDPYLGLLASIAGCIYLITADEPASEIFWIFILVAFFPYASLAFNYFGLDDRNGLDRYQLLPLVGKEIVWSKNVAYLYLVCLVLSPMFVFAIIRLSVSAVGLALVEVVLLALAFLTWGNLVSVSQRFKMEFYHFASGGSPIDALVGVLFGVLPGAIAIQLFLRSQWWWVSLMLVLYLGLYLGTLFWSGRKFERSRL